MDRVFPAPLASAHCDIPCGIYDPHLAQIAALTTVRMNQLIADLPQSLSAQDSAKLARFVAVKEEHAELCKRELRVLWADYFKPEHLQQHANLHELFWNTLKVASKVRQEVNAAAADELSSNVKQIAEIFWQTKGATTRRQPSMQAVGGEIVYPVQGS
jgi:nickel superoxide dismutase